YVTNDGDAWQWSLERLMHSATRSEKEPLPASLSRLAERLGRRLGEMHALLAQPGEVDGFGFRHVDADEARTQARTVAALVREALDAVRPQLSGLSPEAAGAAQTLLADSGELGQRLAALA